MEAFLAGFGKSFSPGDPAFVFMYVIALFAAAALAIAIERFYYIMIRSNVNADKFMAEIRKLVAGGNMDRAIALCDKGKQKALPFVVLRGLKRAIESETLDLEQFRMLWMKELLKLFLNFRNARIIFRCLPMLQH